MPGSFRRAQIRGSDELFRPTRVDRDADDSIQPGVPPRSDAGRAAPPHADEALGVLRPEGKLVRLTDEEIHLLVDALQHLKYPTSTKSTTKPSMDVFERLEELRQKILGRA